MSRALLDVNVLIALLDPEHVDRERAHRWFASDGRDGWASCAITQNGFVRIVSQPRYPGTVAPAVAIDRLARSTRSSDHEFWNCDASVLDDRIVDGSRIHSGRQLTDTYLLALAVARRGRLVTFDRSVPLAAVFGATVEHLLVL